MGDISVFLFCNTSPFFFFFEASQARRRRLAIFSFASLFLSRRRPSCVRHTSLSLSVRMSTCMYVCMYMHVYVYACRHVQRERRQSTFCLSQLSCACAFCFSKKSLSLFSLSMFSSPPSEDVFLPTSFPFFSSEERKEENRRVDREVGV